MYVYIYTKMSKNLSAKYYQENKEKLQKKLVKGIKIFLKKKNKKKRQYGRANITKIAQRIMKSKSLLSIEKYIIESEKMLYNFLTFFNKSLLTFACN